MEQIISEILRKHGLFIEDKESIFAAMGEILHEAAEKTKREEPYATESIRELEKFSQMIDDYDYFVEMHS